MSGTGTQSGPGSTVFAIALIAVGAAAIAFPTIATFSAKIFIGSFLVVSGIIQVFHAFLSGRNRGALWTFSVGVLEAISGLFLLAYPVAGVMALTLYLAGVLTAAGLMRAFFALRRRAEPGWIWALISGIVTVAIGLMLVAKLPSSAFWAIGLLMGVNIATYGVMLLAIAMGAEPARRIDAKV